MVFPETRWSLMATASLHGDTAARAALDAWCRRYWQPVFAVLRARGVPEDLAQDRTQAFFAYLLEHSTLRRADPKRGRFRTFLLTVLWRFLRDERKRELAAKRGGDVEELALDAMETELPAEAGPLCDLLDREWALATLERVLDLVRRECIGSRGEAGWQVLRGFLPGGGGTPASAAEAATVLGLSEAGVRTEVHRLRHRCREALRAELMGTVANPEDVDDEIEYLGRVLRRSAAV